MKSVSRITMSALVIAFAACGCSQMTGQGSAGWVTLFDGADLNNFDRIGNANWRIVDRVLVADNMGGKENGYLVTKNAYTNFQIRAEFWVDDDANSGIFIRMSDRKNVTSTNSYEVNIFDKRPDPTYGTGAIVGVAKVAPMPKAGGKWNTYDITAEGPHMVVVLNGVKTVDVQDSKHASGPFALQYGGGVVKFRKVEVRPL
jgi:hypothetical protein